MVEYRGFIIRIQGVVLIIEDPYGWKLYSYVLRSLDNSKFIEEGKIVIDTALDIIDHSDQPITNKFVEKVFSDVYTIRVKENTPPPDQEGIARKAALRKSYRNSMIQRTIVDVISTLVAVLISLKLSGDDFYQTDILWCMCAAMILGDLMGLGAALAKKDGYTLGTKGEAMAVVAAAINHQTSSGYGGGVYTGPRARYIGIIVAYRVLFILICGIALYEKSIPAMRYSALILFVVNILQFVGDIRTIKIMRAYNDLDENGHSWKESDVL